MELIDIWRTKNNNNRRAEQDEKFFWYQNFMQNRIFSICRGAYAPNPRLTSNPYIY
jgi:hypothetical protein